MNKFWKWARQLVCLYFEILYLFRKIKLFQQQKKHSKISKVLLVLLKFSLSFCSQTQPRLKGSFDSVKPFPFFQLQYLSIQCLNYYCSILRFPLFVLHFESQGEELFIQVQGYFIEEIFYHWITAISQTQNHNQLLFTYTLKKTFSYFVFLNLVSKHNLFSFISK